MARTNAQAECAEGGGGGNNAHDVLRSLVRKNAPFAACFELNVSALRKSHCAAALLSNWLSGAPDVMAASHGEHKHDTALILTLRYHLPILIVGSRLLRTLHVFSPYVRSGPLSLAVDHLMSLLRPRTSLQWTTHVLFPKGTMLTWDRGGLETLVWEHSLSHLTTSSALSLRMQYREVLLSLGDHDPFLFYLLTRPTSTRPTSTQSDLVQHYAFDELVVTKAIVAAGRHSLGDLLSRAPVYMRRLLFRRALAQQCKRIDDPPPHRMAGVYAWPLPTAPSPSAHLGAVAYSDAAPYSDAAVDAAADATDAAPPRTFLGASSVLARFSRFLLQQPALAFVPLTHSRGKHAMALHCRLHYLHWYRRVVLGASATAIRTHLARRVCLHSVGERDQQPGTVAWLVNEGFIECISPALSSLPLASYRQFMCTRGELGTIKWFLVAHSHVTDTQFHHLFGVRRRLT